jgi:L-amino acid N-acyltransferase YncA
MMTAAIRKARLEDAPGIARVQIDSWRTTYRGLIADEFLQTLSYELREQRWRQPLSDPSSESFLYLAADETGKVIGFSYAGPERSGDPVYRGEVYAIYLLELAQGRGNGRKLIRVVADELLGCGFPSMLLWVFKENHPSRRFYEAIGGNYLREKTIEIGNQTLIEVAYGWKNLSKLAGKEE